MADRRSNPDDKRAVHGKVDKATARQAKVKRVTGEIEGRHRQEWPDTGERLVAKRLWKWLKGDD